MYFGNKVYCPVCDRRYRKFRSAGRGIYRRANAVCYTCKARERDRFIHKFFAQRGEELQSDPMLLLHIAPEKSVSAILDNAIRATRVTADLVRRDVAIRLDIQSLPFPNAQFDAVYCSHVLQDVPNDKTALKAFFDVLKPGGWLLLLVPRNPADTTSPAPDLDAVNRPGRHRAPPILRRYCSSEIDNLNPGFEIEQVSCAQILTQIEQQELNVSDETVGLVLLMHKPFDPSSVNT